MSEKGEGQLYLFKEEEELKKLFIFNTDPPKPLRCKEGHVVFVTPTSFQLAFVDGAGVKYESQPLCPRCVIGFLDGFALEEEV